MELLKAMFGDFFADSKKAAKMKPFWDLPGVRRVHSCTISQFSCFFLVPFGSMLGSSLESFWGPSSLLYSFLVARVAKTGSQKRGQNIVKKKAAKSHARSRK